MTYNRLRFKVDDIREVRGEAFRTIEHNDCTVRALTVATGVPYADAHSLMARLGRKPRKGMSHAQIQALVTLPHVYGYKVTMHPAARTLGQAMWSMRSGRYLIVKTGHAIGCKDGVLVDTGTSGPSSRIKFILKFTPTSELEGGK